MVDCCAHFWACRVVCCVHVFAMHFDGFVLLSFLCICPVLSLDFRCVASPLMPTSVVCVFLFCFAKVAGVCTFCRVCGFVLVIVSADVFNGFVICSVTCFLFLCMLSFRCCVKCACVRLNRCVHSWLRLQFCVLSLVLLLFWTDVTFRFRFRFLTILVWLRRGLTGDACWWVLVFVFYVVCYCCLLRLCNVFYLCFCFVLLL